MQKAPSDAQQAPVQHIHINFNINELNNFYLNHQSDKKVDKTKKQRSLTNM